MARYLGKNAHLVSYGAMSKQPLSLPTSLFIFKNLTAHGFWQSEWYKTRSAADRDTLMKTLVEYIVEKKVSGDLRIEWWVRI
jgi:NADPH:quinone reductase-like Zn-dependent oxidoreductase